MSLISGGKNEGEKETGRLEAFSDGVFAIAITLLVLDIKVPKVVDLPKDKSLIEVLLEEWPVYLAYVTSFLSILVMWINHHDIFKIIKRVDNRFLLINGLLLLVVSFVPFPTSLLAEYIENPGQNTAGVIYAGTLLLIALGYNALWRYASYKNRLLAHDTSPAYVQGVNRQYNFGPLLYLICVVVAFFSGFLSFLLTLALAVFFALPFTFFQFDSPDSNKD